MPKKKFNLNNLDAENAKILADIVVETTTPQSLQVQILNRLAEGLESDSFFETIYGEDLDVGSCPKCGHVGRWLTPEDVLNRMGYVTADEDKRVKRNTTIEDCPEFQEACGKKRIVI